MVEKQWNIFLIISQGLWGRVLLTWSTVRHSHQVNCATQRQSPLCLLCVCEIQRAVACWLLKGNTYVYCKDTADVFHDIHPPRYHFLIPTGNDDD